MLSQKSFAKINFYLEITGKTTNNYHTLNSLMAFLDIYDVITIESSDRLELTVNGNKQKDLSKNPQENIIIKAVNLLSRTYNFNPQIKINLEKNIPVSAGLGGGSTNAATTLLMLNQFYNLNLNKDDLMKYGLMLGADVPFCLNGKTAFVSGIGEVVKDAKISTDGLLILLVNPNRQVSTKQVFELFSSASINALNQSTNDEDLLNLIQNHKNDLQKIAIGIFPEIGKILDIISKQKGCLLSRMSGSGATCFGIFKNTEKLELAYQNLQITFPGFYVQKSKII